MKSAKQGESSKVNSVKEACSPKSEELREYYVYLLADKSKSSEVFYVGKGKGSRVFDHVRNVKDRAAGQKQENDRMSYKIKDLKNNLEHIILRSNLTEEEAKEVEAAVIDLLKENVRLAKENCNKQEGRYKKVRGLRRIDGDIPFSTYWVRSDKTYLCVKVDAFMDDYKHDFMKNTHKLGPEKVNTDYVLLIDNAHVFAVYRSGEKAWKPVDGQDGYYTYVGSQVEAPECDKILGRRVPKRQKGSSRCYVLNNKNIETAQKKEKSVKNK